MKFRVSGYDLSNGRSHGMEHGIETGGLRIYIGLLLTVRVAGLGFMIGGCLQAMEEWRRKAKPPNPLGLGFRV